MAKLKKNRDPSWWSYVHSKVQPSSFNEDSGVLKISVSFKSIYFVDWFMKSWTAIFVKFDNESKLGRLSLRVSLANSLCAKRKINSLLAQQLIIERFINHNNCNSHKGAHVWILRYKSLKIGVMKFQFRAHGQRPQQKIFNHVSNSFFFVNWLADIRRSFIDSSINHLHIFVGTFVKQLISETVLNLDKNLFAFMLSRRLLRFCNWFFFIILVS